MNPRQKPPANASDAAFMFVCVSLSVMALYLLWLGYHISEVTR